MTFIRACQHITNYTAGHETRSTLLGEARVAYPDQHIEADNRLSWMLGKLGKNIFSVFYKRCY
jgi:ferritin-like protein